MPPIEPSSPSPAPCDLAAGQSRWQRVRRHLRVPPIPKRVRIGARLVGALGSLGLVGWILVGAAKGIHPSQLDPGLLAAALACALVAWPSLAAGWACLSPNPTPSRAVGIWSQSQVLRYLPGKVWAQAARAGSVPQRTTGKVQVVVVEAAATVSMAVAVGGFLYAPGHDPLFALGLVVPVGLLVVAWRFPRLVGVPPRRIAMALGCYAVSWTAYGLAAVFAQAAIGPSLLPWTVAGAAVLGWVFGFVTFVAPGGLGLREAAFVFLLAGALPSHRLEAGALVTRVAITVAELTLLTVVLIAAALRRRREAHEPPAAERLASSTARVPGAGDRGEPPQGVPVDPLPGGGWPGGGWPGRAEGAPTWRAAALAPPPALDVEPD